MADLRLALAGHAPNRKDNIEYLLTDWLRLGTPDDEGYYPRPDRYKTVTILALLTAGSVPAGLVPALQLLPFVDGARFEIYTDAVKGEVSKWARSADEVHASDDPMQALVSALADGPSPRLLINWLDTDADDERLIELAHEEGITVLDLVEGLTEIVPDVADEPEEPEEAPKESAPHQSRPAGGTQEVLEEPRELLDETPTPAPPIEPQPEKKAPDTQPVQITVPVADTYSVSRELAEQVYGALVLAGDFHNYLDCQEAIRQGKGTKIAERSHLTQELVNTAEMLRAVLYGEEPYQAAPKKPAKAAAKPGKVIWDEAGQEWKRAGRGRVRAGTRVGMMDEAGNVTIIEAA